MDVVFGIRTYVLCFAAMLAIQGGVRGQQRSATENIPAPSVQTAQTDTTFISARLPDTTVIEEYAAKSDFKYEGSPPNKESLLGLILYWVYRLISYIAGTTSGSLIIKILVYLAIGLVVLLLINQLLDKQITGFLRRKNPDKRFSPVITEEELGRTDYEQLYTQALANHNYADATRFAFLIILQRLVEKNLLRYGIEKTNRDYIRELSGQSLVGDFEKLTGYYEYSEYGNFEITEEKMDLIKKLFGQLRKASE